MKAAVFSILFAGLPASAYAGLFDLFSDACLAPTIAEGVADPSDLNQINPDDYGLRGGQLEHVSVFMTRAEDYYVRLFDQENMQCTAHHFDYGDAVLKPADYDAVAQSFELSRRADCDQTSSGGQRIVYYQFQEGYTVTTVWLNTDENERVTWMGLTHAKNGTDCS